jgi:hypothetical protein
MVQLVQHGKVHMGVPAWYIWCIWVVAIDEFVMAWILSGWNEMIWAFREGVVMAAMDGFTDG